MTVLALGVTTIAYAWITSMLWNVDNAGWLLLVLLAGLNLVLDLFHRWRTRTCNTRHQLAWPPAPEPGPEFPGRTTKGPAW
jgi:hypothetical protein